MNGLMDIRKDAQTDEQPKNMRPHASVTFVNDFNTDINICKCLIDCQQQTQEDFYLRLADHSMRLRRPSMNREHRADSLVCLLGSDADRRLQMRSL